MCKPKGFTEDSAVGKGPHQGNVFGTVTQELLFLHHILILFDTSVAEARLYLPLDMSTPRPRIFVHTKGVVLCRRLQDARFIIRRLVHPPAHRISLHSIGRIGLLLRR